MPTGDPASSATTMEPTRSSFIVRSTSRSGVSARQDTAGRLSVSRSGASMLALSISERSAPSRSARCARSTRIDRWSVQKAWKRGLRSISAWKSAAGSSQQNVSACAR
jgi:hypothetical protein